MIIFPAFIELTRRNGVKILIRTNQIATIYQTDSGTEILTTNSGIIMIKETYEEISRFLSSVGEK